MTANQERKVTAKECRFAVHIPSKSSDVHDVHLVKEIVHYDNGDIEPKVTFLKNFIRPFWVTKKAYRNHTQKKESESIDKLTKYETTQSNLRFMVAKALDMSYSPKQLNQLAESPFLYGSDISSCSIIKQEYLEKYPNTATPYSVAFLDIETDVIHGTEDPIMITVLYKNKLFFSADVKFFKGYTDIKERYFAAVDKYIKEYVDKHNFEIEFHLAEDVVDMLSTAISRLHTWSPDFVAIWNIGYDIPKIIETFEKYNVDPKDVFSHPTLPPAYRFCKYKKGSTKKVTASGQVKPKNPSEQWHSLLTPAGFWFIDQMSSYRFVRQGGQEEQSYDLDSILDKVLGIRKLKFKEAEHVFKLDWHKFMQKNYPFEYCVYNNFDCIGSFELELETNDLSMSVPIRTNISEFSRFDSQTKRFADKYHYFLLKRGEVISTVPPAEKKPDDRPGSEEELPDFIGEFDDEYVDEIDEEDTEDIIAQKSEVLSLRNWIVTLKSHMSVLGLPLIKEIKSLSTLIRGFVYDSDAVSAYPTCTAVGNVSRSTTFTEIIDILGVDEEIYRQQGINLLQGHVNSLEYCNRMFNLPKPTEILHLFADMED